MAEAATNNTPKLGDVIDGCIFMGSVWQDLRGRDLDHAMQTASGLLFWPLEAHIDEININDISLGMAEECRFGNQTPYHYSVAWHSVVLSHVVPDHLKKWALIHDATEAYLLDIPRPLKRRPEFSKNYVMYEKKLMTIISEYFGMAERETPAELEEYDSLMGTCELLILFPEIGEAKLKARGFTDLELQKSLIWSKWVQPMTIEEAKHAWEVRYCALFDEQCPQPKSQ